MKLIPKRNASIPHSQWKLKWGGRHHSNSVRPKRPSDANDTQKVLHTSAITF